MTMTVTLDDASFQLMLTDFPVQLYSLVKTEVSKTVINVQKKITNNFETSGGVKSRTGKLKKSLQTNVVAKAGVFDIQGVITGGGGSAQVVYALLQEKGGTVTAKNKYLGVPGGPYLNIPTQSNKTNAGVMKQNAGMVFAGGGYIVKSQAGNYLVMSKQGIPMFVLKKQVDVPPRLKMIETADAETPALLATINTWMQLTLATQP